MSDRPPPTRSRPPGTERLTERLAEGRTERASERATERLGRDETAGRYSLTSERPPRVRRKSSQAPPMDGSPSPSTPPLASPMLPARLPRETMRGFAARPDIDPLRPSVSTDVLAQATEASYPGPMATPIASPAPADLIRSIAAPPPSSWSPSSDEAPTALFHRSPSVAPPPLPVAPYAPSVAAQSVAPIEPPPDTARKLSIVPPAHIPSQPPSASSPAPVLAPPVLAAPAVTAPAVTNGTVGPWEGTFDPSSDVEWQKLWLATQRRPWRSLAVIPSGSEIETVRLSQALALLAFHHLGKTLEVLDATRLTLGELERRLNDMSARVARGESMIVAFGSILDNPASLSLARATDAALLCIMLGKSRITAAENSIAEIGAAKFIGSVVVDASGNLR